jgi:hypothetical protein
VLEIVHQRQRRAECEMLEQPHQFHESLDVASASPANQMFVIHCRNPFTIKVPGTAV